MKRKQGMSLEAFRNYYENRHMPLCMKYAAGMKLYRRRYLDSGGALDFDVITELGFADAKTRDIVLDTMARDRMPPDVIDDEANFLDRAATRAFAVTECETDLNAVAIPSAA